MLLELLIRDFAIIEQLHLRLERGLNVLTGETGAGKTIIMEALSTLRGAKTTPNLVRAGSQRARVEGIFSLTTCPDLEETLREYGLWDEESDQVILTREINAESGRSVARINGRATSTAVLRQVGERLVDIHGQHEGLALFNTRLHIDFLDRYGDLFAFREQVGQQVAKLQRLRAEIAALQQNDLQRLARIEELRSLLEDVQTANLEPNEEENLVQKRTMLQNAERIAQLVNEASAKLYQGEESGRYQSQPIVEAIATVASRLTEISQLDPTIKEIAQQATDLQYFLADLADNLRVYNDNLDFDSRQIDLIEDRLTLLRDLKRRYRGEIAQILARAAAAEHELAQLTQKTGQINALKATETELLTTLGQQAQELSNCRRATGDALAQAIEQSMAELAMPFVKFQVALRHEVQPNGLPCKEAQTGAVQQLAFDKTGIDRVEFLLAPNPGEPLKPLAQIASGGEGTRLLLALKSILAQVDPVPTLVFDEIDAGVGGRAGQVVGQKLWTMARARQVLCITHLSQVAAFADAHFAISKEVVQTGPASDHRTRTIVRPLAFSERIDELAAMLDGVPVSSQSRASAREIIDRTVLLKSSENLGQSRDQGRKEKGPSAWLPLHL